MYSIWLAVAAVMIGAVPCEAADDVFSYQFNAADQLGSVNLASASIGSFAYDGDGLRTRKEAGGETVFYLRDDTGNVIAEYDQNGALLAEYVYSNSQRAAKIEPGDQRSYYHADVVGTPLVITDSAGNASFRGDYRPFGTEEEATGTPDRRSFTGKEYDGEFGLFYFNARYYDSRLGRFVSVDPVAGKPLNPQSWNRYAYVENNPLTLIDPTGEDTLHWDESTTAEVYTGDVLVIGTRDANGRVTPAHVSTYQEQGSAGTLLGYESTLARNQDLSIFTQRNQTTDPDNTGAEHHLVDLTKAAVNGRPNPYSPFNGAVLMGVIPATNPVSTSDLAAAADSTRQYYGENQCFDFTWNLSRNAGTGLQIPHPLFQRPTGLGAFFDARDPSRITTSTD